MLRASPTRLVMTSAEGQSYIAHEVVVRPAEGVTRETFATLVAGFGAALAVDEAPDPAYPFLRLLLPDTLTADEAIDRLRTAGLVASAERNYLVELFADPVTPNDPRFGELWGLSKIHMPQTWAHTQGSSDVVVGVSDTGIDYTHPDLAPNIWSNPGEVPGNGKDDDGNGYVDDVRGWDFLGNDNDPMDDHGHGTHVAGTIGARGNDGVGVAGVNWKVKLVPLKFLGSSGGTMWAGAQTILYAARIKAKVVNASWGCAGPSCYASYLQDAITQLGAAGGLFVAAAGNNNGNDNDSYPTYPANYGGDNVVSVAATGSSDTLASFSNIGATKVHLAAPGVGIVSTIPGNRYASFQGTSMAAPHVAGVAALLWSLKPSLTAAEAKERLLSTVDKVPALTGKVASGGRLAAFKAVMADGEPPPAPRDVEVHAGAANDLVVSWAPVAVEDLGGYRVHFGPASGGHTNVVDVPAGQTQLVLRDLEAGKAVFVVVVALDRSGNRSPPSAEVSAVPVDATPPPQVVDLRASTLPGTIVPLEVSAASGQFSEFWSASQAADGNPQTAWLTPGRFVPQEEHLVLRVPTPALVDRVELLAPTAYPDFFPVDFDIDVSIDGLAWTTVGGMRGAKATAGQRVSLHFAATRAQAVRVRVLRSFVHDSGYGYAGLAEVTLREVSSHPDTILLTFTAPGDDPAEGAAARYDVRVSESPLTASTFAQATVVSAPTPAVAGLREEVMVSGLAGERGYYFALRAIDDGGNASPISNIAYVPPLSIPPGAVTDLRLIGAGPHTLTLAWTAPGGDGALGQAQSYDLRFSRSPLTPGNFSQATPVLDLPAPQPSGHDERAVIDALEDDGYRYFALRALDATGTPGPISNVVMGRLDARPDESPPATVSDLSVHASQAEFQLNPVVSASSPSLSTSTPPARLLDGNIDTPWIAAAASGTTAAFIVLDLGDVHAVTGLRMNPGQGGGNLLHYPGAFQIQASADAASWQTLLTVQGHRGQHGRWDSFAFAPVSTRYLRLYVTERGVDPGASSAHVWIGELEVFALTPQLEIDLTWVAPGDDGYEGTATRYDLRHAPLPLSEANFAAAEPLPTPIPSQGGRVELLRFPPLARESRNYFRLTATDDAGNVSGLSNEAWIETPGIPPAPVMDLKVVTSSRTSATLSFTATGDDGLEGTATAYELRYSTQPLTPERWDLAPTAPTPAPGAPGTKETVRVEGLSPNTQYYFVLKVVDDLGHRSLASNAAAAETLDGTPPAAITDLAVHAPSGDQELPVASTLLASSGSYTAQTEAKNLFDGQVATAWLSPARPTVTTEMVHVDFGASVPLGAVRLQPASGYEDLFPVDFRLETRPDTEGDWIPVVTEAGFGFPAAAEDWALGRVLARQARLVVTRGKAFGGAHYVALGELAFFAEGSATTALQLTWTAPGDDGQVGRARAYDLRQAHTPLSPDTFPQAQSLAGVPSPSGAGALERFDVANLAPETSYCFAVQSHDDVGLVSELSNSACATTAPAPPGTVVDLAVVNLSAQAATLTWTAPTVGAPGARYDLRYARGRIHAGNWDTATPVAGLAPPGAAGSPERATVTGLAGLTTYHFALRALDAQGGRAAVSNNARGTTLDDVPPGPVADLAVTGLVDRPGALRVSFTAPGDNGPVGQAARYELRVSETPLSAANFATGALVPTGTPRLGGTRETVDIDNLGPEAVYYVALRAFDAAGNVSAVSNVASGRTRDEAPAAITDLVALEARGTSAAFVTLQWTAPGDDGTTGSAHAYEIRYSTQSLSAATFTQGTLASGAPSPRPPGTVETFKLSGVTPGAKIFVALRAVDERNNAGPISNVAQVTVPDEWAPSGASDLQARTGGARGSVTLTWTAPGDDGDTGKASAYELRYAAFPLSAHNFLEGLALVAPSPVTGGGVQSFTASGLPDEAPFYFALRARDDAGNLGPVSNSPSARTPDVAPAAVTDLALTSRTNASVTVSFTATGDDGQTGTASRFDLRLSEQPLTASRFASGTAVPTPPPAAPGTRHTVTVSGLASTRTYYLALRVEDERGNTSLLSNMLTAETVDEVPPGAISDLVASTGSGNGSVVLAFTAPGDDGAEGQATAYEVRRAQAPITADTWGQAVPVTSALPKPARAGSFEQLTLTNLDNETPYHFAVRALDDQGLAGPISNSASASTRAVPPAAVLNLKATASASTVTLSFTAPGDDGNQGQAKLYDLRMSKQPLTPLTFAQGQVVPNVPLPATAGTPQTVTISGLEESTTYHFALKTKDDVDAWSSLSNVASATTPDLTAPAAPGSLAVKAPAARDGLVLPTKAQASSMLGPAWDASLLIDGRELTSWASAPSTSDASHTVVVELEDALEIDRIRLLPDPFHPQLFPRDFSLETSVNKQTWDTVAVEEEFSPSNAAWLVWGFPARKAHFVRLSVHGANTSFGQHYALVAELQVQEAATTDGRAVLSWVAPGDDGTQGVATRYEVYRSPAPFDAAGLAAATLVPGAPTPAAPGSLQAMTVTGLAGEAQLYWALRAVDEAGNLGPLSTLVPALTNAVPPAPVVDLEAEPLGQNRVALSWTAPGDDHTQGRATAYELRSAPYALGTQNFPLATEAAGVPPPAAAGSRERFTVEGLAPGKLYRFGLVARDEAGHTSYLSNVAVALTDRLPDITAPEPVSDLQMRLPRPGGEPLAAEVVAVSSAQAPQFPAEAVLDGDPVTAWASLARTENQLEWLRLDLGELVSVNRIDVTPSAGQAELFPRALEVALSPDGLAWTVVWAGSGASAREPLTFAATEARFVEVRAPTLAAHDNGLHYAVLGDVLAYTAGEAAGTAYGAFTAPADDGPLGRATRYELVRSGCPFDAATSVAVPTASPLAAGTPERLRFSGLAPGAHCVAVRSADEAGNLSDWSPAARVDVP